MSEVNFCPRCGGKNFVEFIEADDDGKIAVNVLERDFYDTREERDEIMQPRDSATICELTTVHCDDCGFEFYHGEE